MTHKALRYDRQELIAGWNQKLLTEAEVTIVGADVLAQYTALSLAALGCGRIRLLSSQESNGELFLDHPLGKKPAVQALEEIISKINPHIKVLGLPADLRSNTAQYFLERSQLVIETTNDPYSKAVVRDYALRTNTAALSASCTAGYGKIVPHTEPEELFLLPEFEKCRQDGLTALVLGGMITEEAKKIVMKHADVLARALYYNLTDTKRFSYERKEYVPPVPGEFRDKKVLLVGAGALGNFVGLGLAALGIGQIDLVDFDTVEDTNLNRQVLYYDGVGKQKAVALAEKLKVIHPAGLLRHYADKFTPEFVSDSRHDLIFDCVDNFLTRAMISDYAVQKKIPLISGATDVLAGQVALYVPGKTSCMNCQLDIVKAAIAAVDRARQSCVQAPNPSVIMTNQVIGGMMVNEAATIFNSEKYGAPINGVIKYTATLDARVGVNALTTICACTENKIPSEYLS